MGIGLLAIRLRRLIGRLGTHRLPPTPSWLRHFPCEQGVYAISAPRFYATDEAAYTNHGQDASIRACAAWLKRQLAALGGPDDPAVVLELACGPGALTLGLLEAFPQARVLASDASPAFLAILQQRLSAMQPALAQRASFLQLCDEDLQRLPQRQVDLVVVRAGLHHFLDWRERLRQMAAVLSSRGVIALYEPRADFFLLTATLLQLAMAREGEGCSDALVAFVDQFDAATRYYILNEVDKTNAEDKHAFFLEDLMLAASASGLRVVSVGSERPEPFSAVFRHYLSRCMGASDGVMQQLEGALADRLEVLDQLFAARDSRFGAAEWLVMGRVLPC